MSVLMASKDVMTFSIPGSRSDIDTRHHEARGLRLLTQPRARARDVNHPCVRRHQRPSGDLLNLRYVRNTLRIRLGLPHNLGKVGVEGSGGLVLYVRGECRDIAG